MLTPTDFNHIRNFDKLRYNHQKIFRHRVKKKCKNTLKDIKYVLLNYQKLRIRFPEKIVNVDDLVDLIQVLEDLKKITQSRK